ncbi:MAG: hypothetical protein ACLFWB_02600 [Armatimonadota bacterium]
MADIVVAVFALVGAVIAGLLFRAAEWPWYAWVPAAFLVGIASVAAWFAAWFLVRKLTYPIIARKQRRASDNPDRQHDG